MTYRTPPLIIALAAAVALAACGAPPTATPIALKQATALPRSVAPASGSPQAAPAAATASPTPSAGFTLPAIVDVQPTAIPRTSADAPDYSQLPVGQAGHYVNLALGYWLQYPLAWRPAFGDHPIRACFSDLDPAKTLDEMRAQGCLIEVRQEVNIAGLSLAELRAQMPRAFPNAQEMALDGMPGLRVLREQVGQPYASEYVYVERGNRLFVISIDYGRERAEGCLAAWENLLQSWRWLEPQVAPYRNIEHGYSLSTPVGWFRFNEDARGVMVSDQDPRLVADDEDLITKGMLVQATVHENSEGLSVSAWAARKGLNTVRSEELPLTSVTAWRAQGDYRVEGVEYAAGYYQGSLGEIIEVICLYPADQNWRYNPIASAVLFSFGR
ncbi:MAG: hypothetical protein V1772_02175 [Chloroflexota bacterium]